MTEPIKLTLIETKTINEFRIRWEYDDKLWVAKGYDDGWPILHNDKEVRGYGHTPEDALKDLRKELNSLTGS